jgi:hypothetical protein
LRPGSAFVADIAADGRLLLTHGEARNSIRALVPGEPAERDFPWLDSADAPSLSRDGRHMAFTDLSQSAGADYAIALRDIAGEKVVRLGPGVGEGLSPDAKWVVGLIPSTLKLVVYPAGPGDPVWLERGKIDLTGYDVKWFSDSTRVLYCGASRRRPPAATRRTSKAVRPLPVTPDDVTAAVMAGDDRTLLLQRTSGAFQMMTIGGGALADAKGFLKSDMRRAVGGPA